jgi:hypothetical protein
VLPSGEVVCGPCVRRAWDWLAEHGKKTYRVGKKGKGSKYIAFPTGITKKNARRTTKRRPSAIPLIVLTEDGFSLRYVPGRRIWEARLMPDDLGWKRSMIGTTAREAADALMTQEGRKLEPWNFIDREAYETGRLIDLKIGVEHLPGVIVNKRRTSRRRTSRRR